MSWPDPTCAIKGCGNPAADISIMCPGHWCMVPPELRLEIKAAIGRIALGGTLHDLRVYATGIQTAIVKVDDLVA